MKKDYQTEASRAGTGRVTAKKAAEKMTAPGGLSGAFVTGSAPQRPAGQHSRNRAPSRAGLIARAVANLPDGVGRPRVRADAGYFDAKVAQAAFDNGADFAIAEKRNTAAWRALAGVDEAAWVDRWAMPGGHLVPGAANQS